MAGMTIQGAMRRAGVRQEDLAAHLGISQSAVSSWVRGKTRPEIERVAAIAECTDADSIDLVLGTWPELAARDRLARLRQLLSDATTAEIDFVTEYAEELRRKAGRGRR